MPLDSLYNQLLDSLIDRKISAQAARDAGLAEDRVVRMRVAMATEAVLQETYIVHRIEEAVTEERLRTAYQKAITELPPRDEVRSPHPVKDRTGCPRRHQQTRGRC